VQLPQISPAAWTAMFAKSSTVSMTTRPSTQAADRRLAMPERRSPKGASTRRAGRADLQHQNQ